MSEITQEEFDKQHEVLKKIRKNETKIKRLMHETLDLELEFCKLNHLDDKTTNHAVEPLIRCHNNFSNKVF